MRIQIKCAGLALLDIGAKGFVAHALCSGHIAPAPFGVHPREYEVIVQGAGGSLSEIVTFGDEDEE